MITIFIIKNYQSDTMLGCIFHDKIVTGGSATRRNSRTIAAIRTMPEAIKNVRHTVACLPFEQSWKNKIVKLFQMVNK